MKIVSELEDRLATAVQKNDAATLGRLLNEEFQAWTPAGNGDPIPRDEWLRHQAQCITNSAQMRNLAVRVVGEAYIASFVQVREATCSGTAKHSAEFIVDVWQKNGESWQLTDRYASPVWTPERPKKPTGKE